MSRISTIAYIVLALAIGYAFIYSSLGDINSLSDQKQKYLDSMDMITTIENKKAELQTKFDQIPAADKENIDTVLPNSLDFVKLVSQIDAVASGYGVSITNISLKENGSPSGGTIDTAAPAKPYSSAVIGFSFNASYDKFNAFVGNLEKSLRILDIKSVRLQSNDNGTYSYDVEFETYWLEPA